MSLDKKVRKLEPISLSVLQKKPCVHISSPLFMLSELFKVVILSILHFKNGVFQSSKWPPMQAIFKSANTKLKKIENPH